VELAGQYVLLMSTTFVFLSHVDIWRGIFMFFAVLDTTVSSY